MSNPIQWYPGHMSVSSRMLDEQIKQCDVIIYVLDARCPCSCKNPDFEKLCMRKPVVFYYSKSDLAPATAVPFAAAKLPHQVISQIGKLFPNKTMVRAMVIGVPNSGKSTLINKLSRSKKTLTGDRPGITRTKQWVSATDKLWLLDTPGVLWPKLEDTRVAKNLAYVGTIKDEILDIVELATDLLADLATLGEPAMTLQDFCRKRGFMQKGGELDELRGARSLLHDFRAGKLGKFNLDRLLEHPQ